MDQPAVRYEDVTGLKSRVSWGAVFGGASVAVAVYLLFTLFFAAVGVSLTASDVDGRSIGIAGVIAAVVSLLLALFIGGCVTSQLTAGETTREATIHGVLTWAVVTAFSMWMATSAASTAARAGYGAMLSANYASNAANVSWEESARRAGVSPERIDAMKRAATPENAAAQAQDPANREAAREAGMWVTWGGFIATLLAMGASVLGARYGAGPNFRLFGVRRVEVAHGRAGLAGA